MAKDNRFRPLTHSPATDECKQNEKYVGAADADGRAVSSALQSMGSGKHSYEATRGWELLCVQAAADFTAALQNANGAKKNTDAAA